MKSHLLSKVLVVGSVVSFGLLVSSAEGGNAQSSQSSTTLGVVADALNELTFHATRYVGECTGFVRSRDEDGRFTNSRVRPAEDLRVRLINQSFATSELPYTDQDYEDGNASDDFEMELSDPTDRHSRRDFRVLEGDNQISYVIYQGRSRDFERGTAAILEEGTFTLNVNHNVRNVQRDKSVTTRYMCLEQVRTFIEQNPNASPNRYPTVNASQVDIVCQEPAQQSVSSCPGGAADYGAVERRGSTPSAPKPPGSPRPPDNRSRRPFTIYNDSGQSVEAIYLSLASDSNWGSNDISSTLYAGNSADFNMAGDCTWDLMVELSNGQVIEEMGIDTCLNDSYSISQPTPERRTERQCINTALNQVWDDIHCSVHDGNGMFEWRTIYLD